MAKFKAMHRVDAFGCFDSAGEDVRLEIQVELDTSGAGGLASSVGQVAFEAASMPYLKSIAINFSEWELAVLKWARDDLFGCHLEELGFSSSDVSAFSSAGYGEELVRDAIVAAYDAEIAKR